MSDDGFLFKAFSEFKQDVINMCKEKEFPSFAKKFLKKESAKCAKIARKIATKEVGTSKGKKKNWIPDKSYHKKFKSGKPYEKDIDLCCRAYNSSPHGHLIEKGHFNVPRGQKRETTKAKRAEQFKKQRAQGHNTFCAGRHILEKAELKFLPQFESDTDKFLFEYFGKEIGK